MATKFQPELTAIAVAGWRGYIGTKITSAAIRLGIPCYGYDCRDGLVPKGITEVRSEQEFYSLPVPLYHLALQPTARAEAQRLLFQRASAGQLINILMEKPMADPGEPNECERLIHEAQTSGATVLYNFHELYDPLWLHIQQFLRSHPSARISSIHLERGKDRERDTPRNRIPMLPIQYQESVHCMAFALAVLGEVDRSYDCAVNTGISVRCQAAQYRPPNPEIYRQPIDGCCRYEMHIGDTLIQGTTDFTKGSVSRKLRRIEGFTSSGPFRIDVNFQEGEKSLIINDRVISNDPRDCSYSSVLRGFAYWKGSFERQELMTGRYPNPHFAELCFRLSDMLWQSSQTECRLSVHSAEQLRKFRSDYGHKRERTSQTA